MNLQTPTNNRLQYVALAGISLGAIVFTSLLSHSQRVIFEKYFGNIHPVLAVVLIAALGVVALSFLRSRGFEILATARSLRGITVSAALATLFAIFVTLVDLGVGFPQNMNVPVPQSLLFYPAIGYVAEIVFHVLPLAILLFAFGLFSKQPTPTDGNRQVWICIIIVASFEPTFQVVFALLEHPLSWLEVFVGLHVFAISLSQLYLFRRYDFVTMYSFRLVYYLYWHIVWGHLRLQLLF